MNDTQTERPVMYTCHDQKAWEWLNLVIQMNNGVAPVPAGVNEPPRITGEWDPRAEIDSLDTPGAHSIVYSLLREAQEAGVITGPGELEIVFEEDDGDGISYRYTVATRRSSLYLATPREDVRRLGHPGPVGAAAAVAILGEAVQAANRCLAALPLAFFDA
jgi:hypothetical protein